MQWWQTLLIALCPSVLSTIVAIVVPVTQIRNAKKETLAKYEYEIKQYISHRRFDMQFDVYVELSEKVVELAVKSLGLFTEKFDYSKLGKVSATNDEVRSFNKIINLQNDANKAIYKYAVFIPKNLYEKFDQLKISCRKQTNAYRVYYIDKQLKGKTIDTIKAECKKINNEISKLYNELVVELRNYIYNLGEIPTEN